MLYTSDFQNGKLVRKAPTVDCTDDANILLLAKKDSTLRLYRNAHTTAEKYTAWQETCACRMHGGLVFSDDSVAYKIGVQPLRKRHLQDFTPDGKIVNRFEEILRHNNVSDKENAFHRLITLFICKLVDESTKGEDDEESAFYPTDHCGVVRCQTTAVHPRYLAHILDAEGKKLGFSRSFRASIDRVQGIAFSVPDRARQDAAVAEVEAIEAQPRAAEAALGTLEGNISAILEQYLK